jgi:aryl-alcohol dehydrogenase-like predicted oxidoreductase
VTYPNGQFLIGGDLPVHPLGFGAMHLTGSRVLGEPNDRGGAIALLRRAVELGINLLDTADAYGPEVSERIIAEALHPYPSNLVIATKGGYTRPSGQWVPDGRPQHLKKACEASLRRLKLERIDLYQFHTPDPRVAIEDSMGALAELRNAGKVRHVGVSNFSVEQIERACAIVPIVSVQNHYNIAYRASEPVLKYCERQGHGFIPFFPLGDGRLSRHNHFLRKVARPYGATASQIALAWLLKHSPAMLPIPGTSRIAHLEENARAASLELSVADFMDLKESFRE